MGFEMDSSAKYRRQMSEMMRFILGTMIPAFAKATMKNMGSIQYIYTAISTKVMVHMGLFGY